MFQVHMVNIPNNKKGHPKAALDILQRDSLWWLLFTENREGTPDAP